MFGHGCGKTHEGLRQISSLGEGRDGVEDRMLWKQCHSAPRASGNFGILGEAMLVGQTEAVGGEGA